MLAQGPREIQFGPLRYLLERARLLIQFGPPGSEAINARKAQVAGLAGYSRIESRYITL